MGSPGNVNGHGRGAASVDVEDSHAHKHHAPQSGGASPRPTAMGGRPGPDCRSPSRPTGWVCTLTLSTDCARTGPVPPAIQIGGKWLVSVPRLERFLHGEEASWREKGPGKAVAPVATAKASTGSDSSTTLVADDGLDDRLRAIEDELVALRRSVTCRRCQQPPPDLPRWSGGPAHEGLPATSHLRPAAVVPMTTTDPLAPLLEYDQVYGADSSPTGGAALLDDVATFLGRYVAFPSEHHKTAVTLWTVHTHALAAFESTPRLGRPVTGKGVR